MGTETDTDRIITFDRVSLQFQRTIFFPIVTSINYAFSLVIYKNLHPALKKKKKKKNPQTVVLIPARYSCDTVRKTCQPQLLIDLAFPNKLASDDLFVVCIVATLSTSFPMHEIQHLPLHTYMTTVLAEAVENADCTSKDE